MLSVVAARHGLELHAHVKLSHVIDSRPPHTDPTAWSYATKAEFDWLVIHSGTNRVEFAVELDDATHLDAAGRERDAKKDALCEAAGLELLRLEFSGWSRHHGLPRVGVMDGSERELNLLEYLVEIRSQCKAFREAQEAGTIPDDEIFMPYFVLSNQTFEEMTEDGRVRIDFPYDLAHPARLRAMRAFDSSKIQSGIIHGQSFSWRDGMAEGWAWLSVGPDRYMHARTLVRSFRLDCGLSAGDLAEDLSCAEVGRMLGRFLDGAPEAVSGRTMASRLEGIRSRREDLRDPFLIDHMHWTVEGAW